ncbi:MAG: hypothetical protein C0591_02140 [Marinilabiliales bacterium]|jgi:hypothetical protein|nr:MAG: hypothetical protein C0591_02140 [Marinilabiliales bacterium]
MKRVVLLLTIVLFSGISAYSQVSEIFKNSQVHGSFEFDGAYYMPDNTVGITDSMINGKNFAFNGFGNITYSLGNFSAGFRYEAYLPPLAGFDPRLEGQGFPYLWATYATEKFSFTVGNFYEQFGNGLTFRTYQEWMLGYDNSLNGARVTYEPVKGLLFKGVYGMQRFFWTPYTKNSRGIVKGFDAELDFNQVFNSMSNSKLKLVLGGSFVSNYQADLDPLYNLPRDVGNMAGRMTLGYGKFNITTEYAYKINDPSAINNYIYKVGDALMLSASYSTKGFGFYGMFKRYDNMSYKSNRAVTANALDISFLPPNTETHTYMLTSMYPYNTQPNGEIGYQLQLNYKVPKKSKLGGKYGMGLAINYSQVNDIVRNAVNVPGTDTTAVGASGTLGWTSPFFKFGERIFWQDFNIEIDKKFSKKLKGTYTYMYQSYDIATLEGHTGEPIVYSNIGVIDMTYKFTSNHALRWELQGLWTKEDKGDWAAILLEYTISPHWFVSITDQYNYGNPEEEKRINYYTGSFGYTHETTRISVTYGRQREGIVCVGGVCRAVPASSGFYVTISSNF